MADPHDSDYHGNTPAQAMLTKDQWEQAQRDTARLDWLEKQDGSGLISDDAGRWSVTGDGMQAVVHGDKPMAVSTSFFVEADAWQSNVRQAIDSAMSADTKGTQ